MQQHHHFTLTEMGIHNNGETFFFFSSVVVVVLSSSFLKRVNHIFNTQQLKREWIEMCAEQIKTTEDEREEKKRETNHVHAAGT